MEFKPINFAKDMASCVAFREDSFRISFPGSDRWRTKWDPEKYTQWIQDYAERFPEGAVHLWRDEQLVGQLEFSCEGERGHVNLYYLVPSERGKGSGRLAHEYVVTTLKRHGCKKVTLRVSPENERALKFYEAAGWRDLGEDPEHPEVNVRELVL